MNILTIRGPASAVFGGWDLGAILTLWQGSPFELVTQTNTTNAFTPGSQRVNVLRDPALPADQRRLDRWFDTQAVAAPPALTFGNSGRALLTGPRLAQLDLSLLKNHRWKEHWNAQFRFESLDITNHPNFLVPGNILGSANFGVVSAARVGRTLQLGMRLEF
jgi:hypothetical protein